MLTHAGLGSVADALTFGVPLVCAPVDRDQPLNAQLTMKQQNVASDGSQINVQTGYPVDYLRIMQINPVTGVAWTAADLTDVTLQIGAKVNPGTNGVVLGDLVLECE